MSDNYKHIDNWGDLQYPDPPDILRKMQVDGKRAQVMMGGWEVERADYDTRAGRLTDTAPIVLATETVRNVTDCSQTSEVDLTQSVSETHSFSHYEGFTLEVGAKFNASVPLVGGGKVETKFSAKMEMTWGQSTTVTTTVGQRVNVQAPAHSRVRVTGSMKRSKINVPCTLHLRSNVDRTVTTHSKVIYHGLTHWDFEVDYENA